ncbi:uncharacterized protein LOC121238717 isoform X2 [Juglans microcarpa x Juglans regia]|uniref:uncharacterized protein LOC121238717 isoform X2 n=1 Tax=Juglans microcarpa x Juglans regia TaxID=2249226 RepID=UPI001B7EA50F|nr:uncharacterized protein LOC121238717 isoform X2 [Juglans microcarpa x Juglans regia]
MVKTEKSFSAFPVMQHKENQVLAPPRASDPGWAHGIMVNGGRQKIKCKYCHKIMLGGGISRLKQHLAGERGNVAPCEEVPEDVKVQMQQHLGFKVLERLKRQKGLKSSKDSMSYSQDKEEGDDGDSVQIKNMVSVQGSGKRRGKEVVERISNRSKRHKKQYFSTVAPVVAHSIHQSLASQESMDQADMAVARFLYEAGIQFTAANSQYFQEMADAIAAVGPGYKMPSYHSLRGKLLNRSVQDVSEYVEELRKSWEVTGCSVMVDRWMDRTGRTVINFFVYCPKGTMFLKSVDASDITSPETLLNLFDGVVQEVGPKNIVNFLTDTSPSYKEAGKLLMEKYKTFFCTACGSHCIDLILEEIGKIDLIKEVLAKARQVTQFIYNNAWVLNLMRKKTGGRDIIQHATTRFVSIFLTLQSIVSLKGHLHQMFTGTAWMNSNFSKQRVGLEVAEIIVDPLFWSIADQTLKVTKPLLSVLQLVHSGEKPSVGFIYDAMEKTKKTIIVAFENKESDYLPYLEVINHIWQEEFHSPLHAAAYYLNPSIFYNPSFSSNKVIQKGLLDCIETLEPDLTAQVMITSNVNFYEEAVGDFGRPVALRGRESLSPATWWSLYAADYPDLQRLAVRILSQTCSISRCERSWSMFERIHLKKRNRLEHQRLNDLIFVHYNLRLQERRPEASKARIRRGTLDPMCLEAMDANMGDWVEDPGVLEGEDLSWMDVTVPSETSFVNHKLKDLDDCNDSTDGRDSDDMRGMDDNDDL